MVEMVGLVWLAIVSAPHLRAAGGAAPVRPQVSAAEARAERPREFELSVVGPDGKPVPGAEIELFGAPQPTAEQIRKGKLVRQQLHGLFVATDAEGRIAVDLPRDPERFQFSIRIPGHGPYWARWTSEAHDQPIPPRFTAELEAAWSVGGIVVDPAGKPVAGAEVRPNVAFKQRPGQTLQLYTGASVKTDAAGKWHYDSVPGSIACRARWPMSM